MPFLVDRGLHHPGLLPVLDIIDKDLAIPEREVGQVSSQGLHALLAEHLGGVLGVLFVLVLDLLQQDQLGELLVIGGCLGQDLAFVVGPHLVQHLYAVLLFLFGQALLEL